MSQHFQTWPKILRSLVTADSSLRITCMVAVAGVSLAVLTLLLSQSVIQGVQKNFLKAVLGFNAHAVVMELGGVKDIKTTIATIQAANQDRFPILGFSPYLYTESMAFYQGKKNGVIVKGIEQTSFEQVYDLNYFKDLKDTATVKLAELLAVPSSEGFSIVLGKDLAKQLGVHQLGTTIKMYVPAHLQSKNNDAKNYQNFKVVGFFQSGLYEYDSHIALVHLQDLQQHLGKNEITGIEIKLADPFASKAFVAKLQESLPDSYHVIHWQQLNGEIFSALQTEKTVFLLIMAILVSVACFNMMGVLTLLIHERRKDIFILRALGLDLLRLQKILIGLAAVITLLGIVLGLLLCLIFAYLITQVFPIPLAYDVYKIKYLPIDFSWTALFYVSVFAMILAVLAGKLTLLRLKKIQRVEYQ